jgi:hypothetical protein
MRQLAEEVRRMGRFPTYRERMLRHREDPTFPSEGVFRRIGSKQFILSKLAAFCRSADNYTDVLAVIGPLILPASETLDSDGGMTLGFVYLIKSGRYYKIGRSNSVGRREYELAIQMPEPVRELHRISTDDPPGIERYWHARFAERRKGGEWFDLSPVDVSAFRRRKFM